MSLVFSDKRAAPSRTNGAPPASSFGFPRGRRVPYPSLTTNTGTSAMSALKRARVSQAAPGSSPAWPKTTTPGRPNHTLSPANRPFFISPVYPNAFPQQGDYVWTIRDLSSSIVEDPVVVKGHRINARAIIGGNTAVINAYLAQMQAEGRGIFANTGFDKETDIMAAVMNKFSPMGLAAMERFDNAAPPEKRRNFAHDRRTAALGRTPNFRGENGRVVTICLQNENAARNLRGNKTRPGDKIYAVLKRFHENVGSYYLGQDAGSLEVPFTRDQLKEGVWQFALVSLPSNLDMSMEYLAYNTRNDDLFYGDFTYLYNVQGLRDVTQNLYSYVGAEVEQANKPFCSIANLEVSPLVAAVAHFA